MELAGLKFGNWTVLGNSATKKFYAECQCVCGTVSHVWKGNLKAGASTGCRKCAGAKQVKHGKSTTRVYDMWYAMHDRCKNKLSKAYGYYGGRGIFVDSHWDTFEQFYKDMGDPPAKYSLERLDVNAPYSKPNCVWASATTQNRNKRNTKLKFKEAMDIRYSIEHPDILAKKYNIARPNVHAIQKGVTWRANTIPQMVAECHAKFGIPQNAVPTLLDEATAKFRKVLIDEEAREFSEALSEADMIGQVDALIDLLYVSAGALLVLGLSVEQVDACFAEVQRANMSKVRCSSPEESKRGNSVDLRKPKGWVPPEERLRKIIFDSSNT